MVGLVDVHRGYSPKDRIDDAGILSSAGEACWARARPGGQEVSTACWLLGG